MAIIDKLYRQLKFKLSKAYFLLTSGPVGYARHLGVKVGEGCRIYISTFGSEPFLISIGDRVTITAGVRLLTHNGSTWLIRDENGRRYDYQPLSIGDDVFIGNNAIIMPGVKIENKVIIAAGAVVTKSVGSGLIVGGNPARVIGRYSDYEARVLADYPREHDRKLGEDYYSTVMHELNNNFKPYLNAEK